MGWIKSLFSKTASDGPSPYDVFRQALNDKHEVHMNYRGASDPEPSARRVIPTGMDEKGRVRAFCLDRQAYRTFIPGRAEGAITTHPSSIPHEQLPEDVEPMNATAPTQQAPAANRPKPRVAPMAPESAPAPQRMPAWIVPNGTPWADKDHLRTPRAYAVNPTPEEHEEMRLADANIFKSNDPNKVIKPSYDKATYTRVRNLGASHADCLDAAREGIPIEDYEDAIKNNPGNHLAAKQTAHKYLEHYDKLVSNNNKQFEEFPTRDKFQGKKLLTPEDHTNILAEVVRHHLSLKNAPEEKLMGVFPNTPWRRRANEWCISECHKVEPKFKKFKSDTTSYDPQSVMGPSTYDRHVNALIQHHTIDQLNARTVPEFVASKRKLAALTNLSESKFLPTPYTYDKYEE